MKRNVSIFTHLGNGDHIICNGMLRYFASKKDVETVTTFCYDRNRHNIEYMFRDVENIRIESFPANLESKERLKILSKKDQNNLLIGYEYTDGYRYRNTLSFDETFYEQAGVDFNIRFDNFYVERDEEIENKALMELKQDKQEYIYIHDAPELNYNIDRKKINSKLPVIFNSYNYNLFQMRKILENATEIHTMQTGMFDFCNSIDLKCPIYVHLYVRGYTDFLLSKMNKNNKYILVR